MDIIDGVSFQDEIFKNVEYREETFRKKEFESCRFINCNFSSSHFISCYFENCEFDNCNLSMIHVDDSLFRDVTFTNSKLIGILWMEARKKGFSQSIHFKTSFLNYSSFHAMDLQKCKFEDVSAIEADFSEANLSKVKLTNMDLSGATFYHTNLKATDFTTARNYMFNPSENQVKDALFSLPEAVNLLHPFGIKIE